MNLQYIEVIDLENNRIGHYPSNLLSANLNLFGFFIRRNLGNKYNIDISRIPSVKFE
jgi:hypothetical protein